MESFVWMIIKVFWLLLPAGFANMAPVLFNRVNFLNFPVDGNHTLWGKPILGKHKTCRGFFFGLLAAIVVVYLQTAVYSQFPELYFFEYTSSNVLTLGFVFGFGALFGDSVKSFFKRRVGIASGQTWIFFDQTDWVIGAFALLHFINPLPWTVYITGLIMFGLLHPVVNVLGYWLGLKKNKF